VGNTPLGIDPIYFLWTLPTYRYLGADIDSTCHVHGPAWSVTHSPWISQVDPRGLQGPKK